MSSIDDCAAQRTRTSWRNLAELADEPGLRSYLDAEFPAASDPGGVSRRRWLQWMGASLALAGVSGCRWKQDEILPMVSQPANRLPGQTQRFATARDVAGSAVGLLVTSVDGRPIKIEGNPKHPQSVGATSAQSQASILELYDPDRSNAVVQPSGTERIEHDWPRFLEFLRPRLAEWTKSQGNGLAVLSEASSSPTRAALRDRLLKAYPQVRWYEYEPVSRDNEREGAKLVFGQPYRTQLALDKARVIVCLDADRLGNHPAAVRYARDFAKGRDPAAGPMNRLYVAEPCFTITGSVADHRLPWRCNDIAWLAKWLHAAIIAGPEVLEKSEDAAVASKAGATAGLSSSAEPSADAARAGKVPAQPTSEKPDAVAFLRVIATDLKAHGAHGVVVAGPRQPPEVHALVHEINAALGNVGTVVAYTADPEPARPNHVTAMRSLVADMRAGKIKTLVILGGNPVYDAPADLKFGEALGKVADRIHLGLYENETSRLCTWHLPENHYLESWGDARAFDGTYSIVQPLISPLYASRTAIELLAMLTGRETVGPRELVHETFQQIAGTGWEEKWEASVESGLLAGSAWPTTTPKLIRHTRNADRESTSFAEMLFAPWRLIPQSDAPPTGKPTPQNLELVFYPDASVYDGRWANNSWLQEMPDPMTKLAWDNAVLIAPATAETLGVNHGTLVRLRLGDREVELPAYLMPGQATGSLAVFLGYGRTAAGKVGGSVEPPIPSIGVDVYPLRTTKALDFALGVTLTPTGKAYPLAAMRDQRTTDEAGRDAREGRIDELVREFTLAEYEEKSKHDPHFARAADHHPANHALWEGPKYDGRRWGLTIDLSKCIGCGTCIVACQAENNIPVVGKERILQGREMHWVRLDRYYRGSTENPRMVHQVVGCQQCENAPCEQVCPVAATVHSKEGLNDMVYNRCVGTRYCSNNCPYKVRRFNFFNYRKDLEQPENEVLKMVLNPEVTVRSRGVMEKCTYCVQRIQAAKIEAKNERRPIPDGAIQTACQQACPAGAIVFGDLEARDDAGRPSLVAQSRQSPRAYEILAELNTQPRTCYLARIRNA